MTRTILASDLTNEHMGAHIRVSRGADFSGVVHEVFQGPTMNGTLLSDAAAIVFQDDASNRSIVVVNR